MKNHRTSKISMSYVSGNLMCHIRRQDEEDCQKARRLALQSLMLASKYMAQQKYKHAKHLLLVAMNHCLTIESPDEYTKKLVHICCQEIAIINKESIRRKRRDARMDTYDRIVYENTHQLIVMPFDKALGQFVFSPTDKLYFKTAQPDSERYHFGRQLNFQVSKLNAILFGFNNEETSNSLRDVLSFHSKELLVSSIILLLTCIGTIFSSKIFPNQQNNLLETLTVAVPSLAFILPLLMIYFKPANQRNPLVYQRRLQTQFNKLNKKQSNFEYYLDSSSNLCIIQNKRRKNN